MKVAYKTFFRVFAAIILFSFISCNNDDKKENLTFIQSLPEYVKENILWYCDYEDNSFYKCEGEGSESPYAGGGIFITDEKNSFYGIERLISY
jgi:hypothetical protein